jgi:hypothetical protein
MKKTIGIIIGIIAIGILLLILTSKEIVFNSYKFSNENIVYNTTKIEYLDTIAHVALDILDIHNQTIRISRQSTSIDLDNNTKTKAYIYSKGNQSVLMINESKNRLDNIRTIAHELIHLEQRYSGKLYIDDKIVKWMGIEYDPKLPYAERPWEIDAYRRENILTDQIKSILVD